MRTRSLGLLAGALWLLAGCGSNMDTGGDQTTDDRTGVFGTDSAGITLVGAKVCLDCHSDFSWSRDLVGNYLAGLHVKHSSRISAVSGSCLTCHDPVGDGRTLEAAAGAAGATIPAEGLAAVTCEACHGAGGRHFGVGPLPDPSPDFNVCGQCHRDLPAGQAEHQAILADNILDNFLLSAALDTGHAASFSGKAGAGALAGTFDMSADCARCHTDQGFRKLFAINTGFGEMIRELGNVGPFRNVSVVQCRTCHDPHGLKQRGEGQALLNVATVAGSFDFRLAYSSEFVLCTACHQAFMAPNAGTAAAHFDQATGTFRYELDPGIYVPAFDPVSGTFANPSTTVEVHNPATGALLNPANPNDRTITDTHFRLVNNQATADPADDVILIAGYNINAADERPCTICHDPHSSTKFTQATADQMARDWGTSGHADYSGPAFTHDFSGDSNRPCMKCHNAEQYAKFVQGVPQAELDNSAGALVIACVACHDLQGSTIGALRQVAEVTFPSGAVRNLGDSSNLCALCHQGRESGLSIETAQTNDVAQSAVADYPSFDFINRHYYAEAANLFGAEVTGGFQYPGKTYAGRFPHFSSPNALVSCTDCHMDGDALFGPAPNHNFRPQPRYCNNAGCHPTVVSNLPPNNFRTIRRSAIDYDGDANVVEGLYFEIWPDPAVVGDLGLIGKLDQAIKNYAANTLGSKVVYDGAVYPYFFKDTNGNGLVDAGENVFANRYRDLDRKLLQAAYNFQVVQKDPCGYIHNARYLIQLLIDSIEDLGGGIAGLNRP